MVDAGGTITRKGIQESSPNTKTCRQGLYWIQGPLGSNRVAQHRGHKNSDTLGQGSDIRSSTRILWVLARRL